MILQKAGVDHHVISVFLTAEGIKLTTLEVTNIINTYDTRKRKKYQVKSTSTHHSKENWSGR